MEQWYAVYQKESGELVSTGTVIDIQNLPEHLAYKEMTEQPDFAVKEWDKDSLIFIDRPPVIVPVDRVISKFAFRQRLTFTERCAITASTDIGVSVIREDLLAADEVDLDDPSVALSLDYLISQQLLSPERKSEILGGN